MGAAAGSSNGTGNDSFIDIESRTVLPTVQPTVYEDWMGSQRQFRGTIQAREAALASITLRGQDRSLCRVDTLAGLEGVCSSAYAGSVLVAPASSLNGFLPTQLGQLSSVSLLDLSGNRVSG